MSDGPEQFDAIVVGAGRRGLAAAAGQHRANPGSRLLVVESAPAPGGSIRTHRTNGFVCELGRFAFGQAELTPLLGLLERPPTPVEALPTAASGWLRTARGNEPVAVDPMPRTFRSGNEELAQAFRRELGSSLRLGRTAEAIDHDGDAFVVTLAGEPPAALRAGSLHLAIPAPAAGRLLARFDPALADVAARVRTEPRAFAFLGGDRAAAPELTGYGILLADGLDSPLTEAIFCSEVFPARALPGRFLVRAELASAPPTATDDELLDTAAGELRAWTGTRAEFGLRKLHRFAVPVADGALAECRARLRALPSRVPHLHVV